MRAANASVAAILTLLSAIARVGAQSLRYRLPPEDPQWLKLDLTSASVGVYTEGVFEQSQFGGSSTVDYNRTFIGPSIGLGLQGSIYHPNLARFILNGEGAFGWGWENVRSTTTLHRSQFEELGNFQSTVYLLNTKPYASSISAGYDHTFRDYDFFNRTTVDSWRYGAQTGYRDGPIPFSITVSHLEENEDDIIGFNTITNVSGGRTNTASRPFFGTSTLQQNTLTFDAHNDRPAGNTRFTYGVTDYSRTGYGPENGGTDQTFGLSDVENFGPQRQTTWNNNVGYSIRHFTDAPSDDLNAGSHLAMDHSANLSSYYDADYYRSTFGSSTSDNYDGSASLRHQLYESLTTTLKVEGERYDFSGGGGSSDTTRFGVALNESYTKRLSPSARLTIGGSLDVSHTDVTQSGSAITVIDERHNFPTGSGGGPVDNFFLNLPNVTLATVIITDDTHTLTYIEGLDYTISQNGLLTRITRIGGSRIPSNGSVLATYSAVPSPSGSYNTLNGLLQVRLDFWNGLLGIYGRMNSVQNSGTRGLVVQDLSALALGVDTSWRFLRAGAEYEIYDSDFSSYRSARLFQSLSFRPDDASTLNFDFTEAWTEYLDAHREEEMLSFINRYHRRITRHLGCDIEDGISRRFGPGADQTLATVRPGLDYAVGKISAKLGYDFEYERFLNAEERIKHMFFVRVKRTF